MKFGMRHIRYFTAVAEELHFRRAAERLNIAQPALSRAIAHLESQIGVRLLERTNRQVSLTPAGSVFLKGCRSTLSNLTVTIDQARKAQQGESGHLVIGYTDFAISGELPQILQAFLARYPDVTVEPTHGFTSDQLAGLEAGTLDFGFLTGPTEQNGIASRTVQVDRLVVVLYESHPLAARETISIHDLAEEGFILGMPEGWMHFHNHLYTLCQSAGFEPTVVQRAFNSEGIFGLIACRMGITILTECAENYIRKGLVIRPLIDSAVVVPTEAAWSTGTLTPVKRSFISFLEEYAPAAPVPA